jgi:hypothetical protein
MTPGDLYHLLPMAEKFPHIQALFPYMQGGDALILKISVEKLIGERNNYYTELVDFLHRGEVYTESLNNFKKYATYIGRQDEIKHSST